MADKGANQRIQQGYGSNTRIIQKNTVTPPLKVVTVLHYYKQGSEFENIPSYNREGNNSPSFIIISFYSEKINFFYFLGIKQNQNL